MRRKGLRRTRGVGGRTRKIKGRRKRKRTGRTNLTQN